MKVWHVAHAQRGPGSICGNRNRRQNFGACAEPAQPRHRCPSSTQPTHGRPSLFPGTRALELAEAPKTPTGLSVRGGGGGRRRSNPPSDSTAAEDVAHRAAWRGALGFIGPRGPTADMCRSPPKPDGVRLTGQSSKGSVQLRSTEKRLSLSDHGLDPMQQSLNRSARRSAARPLGPTMNALGDRHWCC